MSDYIKAVWLALRIVRKPWAAPSDDAFDNISWATAWDVSRNIVHPKKGGAALVMDGKIWYGAVARTDTEALAKAMELYEKARMG